MPLLQQFLSGNVYFKKNIGPPIKRGLPTNVVDCKSNRIKLEQVAQYDHTIH